MNRTAVGEKIPARPGSTQADATSWGRTVACCFVAGLIQFLVGYLFYKAVPVVAPAISQQYENAALFRPWAGWTSTYMFFHPVRLRGRLRLGLWTEVVVRLPLRMAWRVRFRGRGVPGGQPAHFPDRLRLVHDVG
jgi:hypothetical protein